MALKADRLEERYDITLICNDVAEAGKILMHLSTAEGSGVAIGDSAGQCTLATDPSGLTPAGMLLLDFVNVNTALFHENFQKLEQVIGDPAPLGTKGYWVTNQVKGTPSVGDTAYVIGTGWIQDVASTAGGIVATPKIGQFKSIKDENGYVKVELNLPVV